MNEIASTSTENRLLTAAEDLQHRLSNIRGGGFCPTFGPAMTVEVGSRCLEPSTGWLRYWAVVERLYGSVTLLAFERNSDTRSVATTLNEIGRTFATDKLDGGRLMVRREEQRAIAEAMQSPQDKPADGLPLIGFASFFDQYAHRFAPSGSRTSRRTFRWRAL